LSFCQPNLVARDSLEYEPHRYEFRKPRDQRPEEKWALKNADIRAEVLKSSNMCTGWEVGGKRFA
jgi:hypothetical protein